VQLDNIIIALKLRSPWEAMDLGVMVMRRMWRVIFMPWLILISIILSFILFTGYHGYWLFASVFMWLIKPVYESMILHILSRAVFGEYLTTGEVFSMFGKWLKTGLKTSFTFWRFSPSRAFNMSVHLLEGLTGHERKQRLNTLHRVTGWHASGLTIIGVHFEMIFSLALYALLFFIMPNLFQGFLTYSVDQETNKMMWMFAGSIVYAIALFILEPFYVASGFMLYLNRRIQLEGWDIELDFKKLAQRLNNASEMNHSCFKILIFCLFQGMFSQTMANGLMHNNTRPSVSNEKHEVNSAKKMVKAIKSKPPFVNMEEEKQWYLNEIEAALWLLPLLAIFYLYLYREYWFNLMRDNETKPRKTPIPDTLFGLDITQETLPNDIEKTARLLYRGALFAMFKQHKFELPPGATEQDCVGQLILKLKQMPLDEIVTPIHFNELQINQFQTLTDIWVSVAYAHRIPEDTVFNQLCLHWNQAFLKTNEPRL